MRTLVFALASTLAACSTPDVVGASEGSSETTVADETTAAAVTTGALDDLCDEDPAARTRSGTAVCDREIRVRPCDEGFYCRPLEGFLYCGDEGPGVCVALPTSCPGDVGSPVCGCDGTLYASKCHARLAGVGTGHADVCEAPEGQFPCEDTYCQLGLHYCEHTLGHGQPETNFCRELPAACTSPIDCECVPQESCTNPKHIGASECEPHDDAWMRVTCVPY